VKLYEDGVRVDRTATSHSSSLHIAVRFANARIGRLVISISVVDIGLYRVDGHNHVGAHTVQ
jgi:hypothetical protein